MWFIGVEVEQETSAPPPKKNPGSAPELHSCRIHNIRIDTTVNSYEGTTRHCAFV